MLAIWVALYQLVTYYMRGERWAVRDIVRRLAASERQQYIYIAIYIDELLLRLKSQHLGCHIGHMFCGAFVYADDVILLAPTLFSLRIMFDVCRQFSDDYDVKFKSSKSKLLFFGRSVDRPTVSPIKCMDNVI